MLEKIVSGGQTGADQAALDAAISCGMAYGGWIPKGRKTEAGPLAAHYPMKEMASGRYPKRTRQNVLDSDGTVVFYREKLKGGSRYTRKVAKKEQRPCIIFDLNSIPTFEIVAELYQWLTENKIGTLNVAGPRTSKDARIYAAVKFVITCLILLDVTADGPKEGAAEHRMPAPNGQRLHQPAGTLDLAANRFISEIPVMDRIYMANMEVEDMETVHLAFGPLVREQFLYEAESPLLLSCREETGEDGIGPTDAATVILHRVWEKLRENDELRLMR